MRRLAFREARDASGTRYMAFVIGYLHQTPGLYEVRGESRSLGTRLVVERTDPPTTGTVAGHRARRDAESSAACTATKLSRRGRSGRRRARVTTVGSPSERGDARTVAAVRGPRTNAAPTALSAPTAAATGKRCRSCSVDETALCSRIAFAVSQHARLDDTYGQGDPSPRERPRVDLSWCVAGALLALSNRYALRAHHRAVQAALDRLPERYPSERRDVIEVRHARIARWCTLDVIECMSAYWIIDQLVAVTSQEAS
jgi:hypothetical protein